MIFTENDMSETLKSMRLSKEFIIHDKNVMVIFYKFYWYTMKDIVHEIFWCNNASYSIEDII